jgi:hypothetical protein
LDSYLQSTGKSLSGLRDNLPQVVARIIRCAKGEYGYVLGTCKACRHIEFLGNCGCGDRNCPGCGSALREKWAEGVGAAFIPSKAFHVVFTLPHQLNAVMLANRKTMLNLIIKSASETLMEFCAKSEKLGGTPFLLSVLHTWTQDLRFHPHVHCLVSAGVQQLDGAWKEFEGKFLFSVKALAKVFRGKVIAGIDALIRKSDFDFPYSLRDDASILDFLSKIPARWNVFCKAPYKGIGVVIRYFARYANRTAISNKRLRRFDEKTVTFVRRRDSAEPEPDARTLGLPLVELSVEEFFRRFTQHIPPQGMHRIRRYGLLSSRISGERRVSLRKVISKTAASTSTEKKETATRVESPPPCRQCLSSEVRVSIFRRNPNAPKSPQSAEILASIPLRKRKEHDSS